MHTAAQVHTSGNNHSIRYVDVGGHPSEVTETELANFLTQYPAYWNSVPRPDRDQQRSSSISVNQFGSLVGNELPIIVQLEVAYGAYITRRMNTVKPMIILIIMAVDSP